VHFCKLSAGVTGSGNLRRARFRFLRISSCTFSARVFLARRNAAVESLQQLRRAIPGAVEHHAIISSSSDLPGFAADLVARLLLTAPPFLGGPGNVFPGLSLDRKPIRGRPGRVDLQLQWFLVEPS